MAWVSTPSHANIYTHKMKINMWTELQGLAVTKTTCGLSFHLAPQEQTVWS